MKTQQFFIVHAITRHVIFIFYPLIGLLLFISVRAVWLDTTNQSLWLMISLLCSAH